MRGRFESSRLAWRCNFPTGFRVCTVFFHDVAEIKGRWLFGISGTKVIIAKECSLLLNYQVML